MPVQYTLRIRRSGRTWWATCDEVPGYVLGADSLEELRSEFRFGLREVLAIDDPLVVEVRDEASAEAVS